MKNPWLVQRCEITGEKLQYDYMGSAEFEFGACPASLERIFSKGLCSSTTTVRVEEKEVKVHIVAGVGFSFSDYQPYLQQMADNALRMKEHSEFDEAIKQQLGIKLNWDHEIRNNGWFDIENDVLWTLIEENQGYLVAHLKHIRQMWAEKEMVKK